MPTKKELLEQAKQVGLCCYWKLAKPELEELVTRAQKNASIPSQFIVKKKIGSSCKINAECRTSRCEDNVCVSSRQKAPATKRTKKQPSPPKQPKTATVAPVAPKPVRRPKRKVIPEEAPVKPPSPAAPPAKPKRASKKKSPYIKPICSPLCTYLA